ncbi:MAG: DUF3754 domain-containing protein [Spirochaetales bacterium]|nr:DUF3754 domain-containing protein [Spirochaetales bacterium]
MKTSEMKERYIPFRKRDVINMVLEDGRFKSKVEADEFGLFCGIVGSIFHFEFHKQLEKLKDSYYPINPDLKKNEPASPEQIEKANKELFSTMLEILNDANYDKITQEEIDSAFNESALVGFSVKIDFDAYEFAEVYARGRRKEFFTFSKFFGLKKSEMEHEILERVILLARLKPVEGTADSGLTFIKMFKDVPLEDLEILFPNSKVTMSLKDKLMLAIPAIVGGVPLLVTKVVPALIVAFVILSAYLGIKGRVEENQMKQAIAAFSALGALGGFIFKQWSKYKTKRFLFQKELSDNLYFRNLVNNAGVFYSLIDSAEEEECKETFLAYYFLYISERGLTENELDAQIEEWMENKHGCIMDFECGDALDKLRQLEILKKDKDGLLTVQGLQDTLGILDRRWDGFFKY